MIYAFLFRLSDSIVTSTDFKGIPQTSPDHSLKAILQVVFAIAGAISVLIITIAGLTMATSQGNPDTVNKSRNAVIYAAVGLAVCVLAFTIVTFVISKL